MKKRIWISALGGILLFGLAACQPTAGKPTIVIVSPPSGSEFKEGENISIQSTAADAIGITRVEMFVDGALARMDPSPSPQPQFSVVQAWKAVAGVHTITVRAYNVAGDTSDPSGISLTVVASIAAANTPPPANPLPAAKGLPIA
ncbi:MAG: Ig-like domain-containing protein [Chloroflexi bacterium]|nr:Ig-like domain-containing protein [Chloroflexota bacterium]